MSNNKFDDIAPFPDSMVMDTLQDLLVDPGFQHAVKYIMPDISWEDFSNLMSQYKTKKEFQSDIIYTTIWMLAHKSTTELRGENWDNIDRRVEHLFLSNHRDIVLDAGFLNILRSSQGLDTTEIAIGDNLLIHPWIEKLVRVNKSFIVKRGLSVREQLLSSKHMSEYIHYAIREKKESVWMAHREGRAKDSNDRTQDSLLKMLTLNASKDGFIESLKSLNIIPVSISYEYDPCDYLKAKEFQLKRDNPDFKKSQRDDLLNMEIGILAQKGTVVFKFAKCINDELDQIQETDKRLQVVEAARIIDKAIHSNYVFFPGNYIAYDLVNKDSKFADKYSQEDVDKFRSYLDSQIKKIDLDYIDYDFVFDRMLEMYSNTLKNYLIATQS